jgi:hypothetical protein
VYKFVDEVDYWSDTWSVTFRSVIFSALRKAVGCLAVQAEIHCLRLTPEISNGKKLLDKPLERKEHTFLVIAFNDLSISSFRV